MPRLKLCKCGCGDRFENEKHTPFRNWATPECAIRILTANRRKQQDTALANKKKIASESRKMTRKAVRNLKENDLRHQLKLTQRVVNKYILLRDRDLPCISCGTTNPSIQYAAGHFKSVGSSPELRFDPRNIHKQCNRRCNCLLSANKNGEQGTIGYIEGLRWRYGNGELIYLDGKHDAKNYTCDDLIEIRAKFAKMNRDIEKVINSC